MYGSEKRKRWIIKRKIMGWNTAVIASHLRISERTVLRYWEAYRKYGYDGLCCKSTRPHTIHRKPNSIVNAVIELRKQHNWGPNKIEAWMQREGMKIGHTSIHKILCAKGMNNPINNPRRTWGTTRFQRNKPNDLWQCDWKLTEDDEWMITYIDDYSRYIVGSVIYNEPTSSHAIKLLKQCIKLHGKPMQILTDQGVQFVSVRGGVSAFTQYCINKSIEHIVASKRRPTTIGKVESRHKAHDYERRMGHDEFVKYWNYERPHQGIGYLIPCELYFIRM
jgi:transposase InsO family protein